MKIETSGKDFEKFATELINKSICESIIFFLDPNEKLKSKIKKIMFGENSNNLLDGFDKS
jgi:hypothetical protein